MPPITGGLIVWKLTDFPDDTYERTQQIMEGRNAAVKAGYESPTLVVLVEHSATKPEAADWFLEHGVIPVEDTSETQDLLEALKRQIAKSDSQPSASLEGNLHTFERWALDSQGYLVLSSDVEESPVAKTDSEHIYQALLDRLNAHSGESR